MKLLGLRNDMLSHFIKSQEPLKVEGYFLLSLFFLCSSSFSGLPTVFHIFAHTIPVEERSRAFAYLVAFGSIGQTVAALVSDFYPLLFLTI